MDLTMSSWEPWKPEWDTSKNSPYWNKPGWRDQCQLQERQETLTRSYISMLLWNINLKSLRGRAEKSLRAHLKFHSSMKGKNNPKLLPCKKLQKIILDSGPLEIHICWGRNQKISPVLKIKDTRQSLAVTGRRGNLKLMVNQKIECLKQHLLNRPTGSE